MKPEHISDALNMLHDDIIEETGRVRENHKQGKKKWWKWAVAAACFVFIVYSGIRIISWGHTKDIKEQLPMLCISENTGYAMGYEGYMAYDVSELVNANPWSEGAKLSTLPVYENRISYDENFIVSGGDFDAMEKFLLDVAARLGMDTDNLLITDDVPGREEQEEIKKKFEIGGGKIPEGYFNPTKLVARENGITIEVGTEMTALIKFEPAVSLPEEYNFTMYSNYEDIKAVAGYLEETFADFICMDKPQVNIYGGDYNIYRQQQYRIGFYEGGGTIIDRIIAYNFNQVVFYCDDDGKLFLARVFHPDLSGKVGDYPVISVDEAEQLLLNGNYIMSVPYEMPGKGYIAKVELVYRTGKYEKYYMPYYRFYVELPEEERDGKMKCYGAYYVPAVDGAYISNMPVWDGSFN